MYPLFSEQMSMVYLHILGEGNTTAERANNKGHLFELLMRDLLKKLNINILHLTKSKHGLEIDIEGEHLAGNAPILAECKAKSDPLTSEDVQKFGFKFLHERNQNLRTTGFLLTLSPLNPKAVELWDELISNYGDPLILYQQEKIIELLLEQFDICPPETIRHQATTKYHRSCGDTQLLCVAGDNKTQELFWAQLLMSSDGTEPSHVVFYTDDGSLITSDNTVDRLLKLKPDFTTSNLTCLNLSSIDFYTASLIDDISPSRTVVRVRMGKDWFDYRFPAPPEFFVGRNTQRVELSSFLDNVRKEKTSTRGIFFSGKSGIGKSSLALKSQQDLREKNIILLPIDSRLCDDISFLYDSVNELLFELRKEKALQKHLQGVRVRGLDSLIETLTKINIALVEKDYFAILFFDQFEKVFEYPDVTKAIRNLFLRCTERQLRILFGFAWKSDLWSQAEGFPHIERDDIVRESYSVKPLAQFGQEETSEILDRLEMQWGEKISDLLRRQLATFSRGLPWLLKKVCAHVLKQKQAGVTQNELIETNLKLKDLFDDDLAGLDDEELSLLRTIAPLLPTTLRRLSESFEIANIDQSLHRFIDKRILVKITEDVGASYANVMYDAYSDIFREFLITGTVPLADAYYFFMYPKACLKFFNKVKERGSLSIEDEIAETGKQVASIYNLSRDLRQLGLVNVNNKIFTVPEDVLSLDEDELLPYLQGKLKQNRLVSLTLSEINTSGEIHLEQVSVFLRELFPSVQATDKTWIHYSRTTATWLHEARLAYYSPRHKTLYQVDDEDIFEQVVSRGSLREKGFRLPVRYKNAIIDCVVKVHLLGNGYVTTAQLAEWLQKKPQTTDMILSDNLNLGFLRYDESKQKYCLTKIGKIFVSSSEQQKREIFGTQCENFDVYNKFIEIVGEAKEEGIPHKSVAQVILSDINLELADLTVDKLGAILANWAEYAGVIVRSGKRCVLQRYVPEQKNFFDLLETG